MYLAFCISFLVLKRARPIYPSTLTEGRVRSTNCGKCFGLWKFRVTIENEKSPPAKFYNIIRKSLTTLNWTEDRRKQARRQTAFIADPFGLTKQLLGQCYSDHLACSKKEVDHLHNTISDSDRERELGPLRAHLNILSAEVGAFLEGSPEGGYCSQNQQ